MDSPLHLNPITGNEPRQKLPVLMLGALGVVYGDIGTSPLYTLKTALSWASDVPASASVLGLFSLIVWTLLITTSLKYVAVVMRADNEGEGGILALMSLLNREKANRIGIMSLGILGAALLYGDGAITPAISVLSALEGLKAPVPGIEPYIVPMAVGILIGLFAFQSQGTARIGKIFGPIMVIWFLCIGLLGLSGILMYPRVLLALNPLYGFSYLTEHGWTGFLVLGAVFLCATGAEALYADMGHFGAKPIRRSWYLFVLPMLLLNYAGQSALVLTGNVPSDGNPFFSLCPESLQIPLVVLATVATIIASQSIISGAFSMTREAIQLGVCPRLHVTQTSEEGYGQIYVGFVNWALMLLTLVLTLAFRSSDALAAAFGIAVALTMLLTSILIYHVMREIWHWSQALSLLVAGLFVLVDLSFVSANLMKVLEGGWVPLLVAAILSGLMLIWRDGRQRLYRRMLNQTLTLATFIRQMHKAPRVRGSAIYFTSRLDFVPVSLLHNLKHNKVLHDRVVLLEVVTKNIPHVAPQDRLEFQHFDEQYHTITVNYGFMDRPDIPEVLQECARENMQFSLLDTSFFIGRFTIVAKSRRRWRKIEVKIFELMHRNALTPTEFFKVPANRVIELGTQIEI
jgi:KUP system potassium uptake protein